LAVRLVPEDEEGRGVAGASPPAFDPKRSIRNGLPGETTLVEVPGRLEASHAEGPGCAIRPVGLTKVGPNVLHAPEQAGERLDSRQRGRSVATVVNLEPAGQNGGSVEAGVYDDVDGADGVVQLDRDVAAPSWYVLDPRTDPLPVAIQQLPIDPQLERFDGQIRHPLVDGTVD